MRPPFNFATYSAFDLARSDRELLVSFQHDGLMIFERARANLGAGKIDQHRQRPIHFLRGRARQSDVVSFLVVRAVRHVYADGVRARGEQRLDDRRLARSGPERGKYLCSPQLRRPLC